MVCKKQLNKKQMRKVMHGDLFPPEVLTEMMEGKKRSQAQRYTKAILNPLSQK